MLLMTLGLSVSPDHLVPAEPFGVVQHGVRNLQIGIVGGARLGHHGDPADADGDPRGDGRVVGDMEILHRLPDGSQVRKGVFRLVAHEEGHKFLAAVAGEKVGGAPQAGGRRLRHADDDLVPGGVAEGVVVHLEFVDVKHTDRKRDLKTDGLLPFDPAVVVVLPPVVYSGADWQGSLPF